MMTKCNNYIKRTFGQCEGCTFKRGPVEFVQDVELIKGKSMTMSTPNNTEQTVCFERDGVT
jgi:hypothetical protein